MAGVIIAIFGVLALLMVFLGGVGAMTGFDWLFKPKQKETRNA